MGFDWEFYKIFIKYYFGDENEGPQSYPFANAFNASFIRISSAISSPPTAQIFLTASSAIFFL